MIMIKFDEKELLTMRKSFFAKLSVLSVLFAFVLYEKGLGVERNLQTAREWYQKAAAQGNSGAKNALERLK